MPLTCHPPRLSACKLRRIARHLTRYTTATSHLTTHVSVQMHTWLVFFPLPTLHLSRSRRLPLLSEPPRSLLLYALIHPLQPDITLNHFPTTTSLSRRQRRRYRLLVGETLRPSEPWNRLQATNAR